MEKYIKISENQDLNVSFLETLALAIINSQQQRIVSLSKNMLFPREFFL